MLGGCLSYFRSLSIEFETIRLRVNRTPRLYFELKIFKLHLQHVHHTPSQTKIEVWPKLQTGQGDGCKREMLSGGPQLFDIDPERQGYSSYEEDCLRLDIRSEST